MQVFIWLWFITLSFTDSCRIENFCQDDNVLILSLPKEENVPYPEMEVCFNNIDTSKTKIDGKAFCAGCIDSLAFETNNLRNQVFDTLAVDQLPYLLQSLSQSEVVIENEQGEMRFFRGGGVCRGCELTRHYDLWGNGWVKYDLIKWDFPLREFYITGQEKKLRIFYLYVPNEEQLERGFKRNIVCSNWVNLGKY